MKLIEDKVAMEVQKGCHFDFKLKPLYNNFPVNAGDYFIHIKTENLYKVIEARDNLIKLMVNGVLELYILEVILKVKCMLELLMIFVIILVLLMVLQMKKLYKYENNRSYNN